MKYRGNSCIFSLLGMLLASMTIAASCKDSRRSREPIDNVGDPADRVLDYSGFDSQSFADVSWEKKCESIANFFAFLSETYLGSDVDVEYDLENCVPPNISKDGLTTFAPKVTLSNQNGVITLIAEIEAEFSATRRRLTTVDNKIFYTGGDLESRIKVFGSSIQAFDNTFHDWATKRTKDDLKVYGLPFTVFANNVGDIHDANSPGLMLPERPLTFHLTQGGRGLGSGKVQFRSVGDNFFLANSPTGETVPYPYLRCMNLDCLNALGVQYELYGSDLYFRWQEPDSSVRHVFALSISL